MSTVVTLTDFPQPDLAAELARRHDASPLPADGVVAGARVAVTSARRGIDRATLDRLPDLEAVVSFGVGEDALDRDACAERGVAVATTPDVLTDAVADTAVGLVIDTLRGFSAADRWVRSGAWSHGDAGPLTREVTGRRVGILGLGRIGTAIADRLAAFRCPISYHNRRPVEGSPHTYVESAEALAEAVDVLVVATPGGPETGVLVDAEVLDRLGPDGILVNIGRGSTVDEDALVDALVSGRIGGAGLDVYADEPHVPEALLALDSVVLLPHVGSATHETRAAMASLVLDNVAAWLDRGALVSPVAVGPVLPPAP